MSDLREQSGRALPTLEICRVGRASLWSLRGDVHRWRRRRPLFIEPTAAMPSQCARHYAAHLRSAAYTGNDRQDSLRVEPDTALL